VRHYNCGRPHKSLGPGVPDPPKVISVGPKSESRHRMAAGAFVLAKSVLGGLHHEYSLGPGSPDRRGAEMTFARREYLRTTDQLLASARPMLMQDVPFRTDPIKPEATLP
jgi:hypothetical protein